MKAISLWQPHATLWLLSGPDEKVFETRDWYCAYRGDLLVHAAKKRDGEVREALESRYFRERLDVHGLTVADLAFGAVIGQVRLIGCCQMRNVPEPEERERQAGLWTPERYAWERGRAPKLFARPIPWKGSQGFFDVPASVILAANHGEDDAQMRLGGVE